VIAPRPTWLLASNLSLALLAAGPVVAAPAGLPSTPPSTPPASKTGPVGQYNRALALLKQGRHADAARLASGLIRNRRWWRGSSREVAAAALYNLSLAFLARGVPRVARRLLGAIPAGTAAHGPARLLLRAAPGPASRPMTCVAQYRARRYRVARRCFRTLLPKTGPDAQILYAIGYSSYQLREYRVALGAFRRVLLVQPADGDALFMAGLAAAQLGHHRLALGFFLRGLKVGLRNESPAEARRYVRVLRKLLASRLRSGWLVSASLTLGHDTHPRLGGSAAAAGTSDGSSDVGSGFTAIALGLGYRWLRPLRRRPDRVLRGALSLGYRFHQVIVFSDLSQGSPGHGVWRPTDVTGGLSLQTHTVDLEARLLGRRWHAGLRVGGHVELFGLRDFGPLTAGGDLEADVTARWNRLTASHLSLNYSPQRALTAGVGYLTGHGLVGELGQSLRYKRLQVAISYRLGVWWLGRLLTPVADCATNEACGLDVPFSNHMHRGQLRLGVRATRWLDFDAQVAMAHRTYWEAGVYRLASGGQAQRRRLDLIQLFRLEARFRLHRGLHLGLAYGFTRNQSTINAQSVGIEEGYDRHRIWASLSYRRW
jgi:tetratricopeptide (TPR) repeat protein